MPPVDSDLFQRARDGDREAFWELILPYRGLIYSVALGMLKNHERAEDHLHEVLLAAFRSLSNLRSGAKLGGWLFSITRNQIMDGMRKEERLRHALQGTRGQMTTVVPVTELVEKEQWLQRLEEALQLLPEPFRVILALKYMNDYSCREIAEILDISVSAVKSRLFEARKLLRKKTDSLAAGAEKGERDHEVL